MEGSKKRELILNGNMLKVVLFLSGPVMLSNFIQTIYNLTDTYFVSKLGEAELAAMGFVWPVLFLALSFAIGMSIASGSLISQYTGAGKFEKASRVAGQIISFTFVFSLICGFLGSFFSYEIVSLMTSDKKVIELGSRFLSISFLGLPTIFLMMSYNSIKQAEGDTLKPMLLNLFSVGLNIILDPIFIFVFNLGIRGAAMATVLSRGIFGISAVLIMFMKKDGIIKPTIHDLKFDTEVISKIIRVGLPSSLGQATSAFGFMILNIFVMDFGRYAMSSFTIGNRINSLVLMPALGIGSALATIVGQNLGADNVKRAKKAILTSFLVCTAVLVSGGAILYVLSTQVVKAFTDQPEVINMASHYLRLIVLALPFVGLFQIFIGVFQGSGHTLSAMIMMFGRLWLFRIPLIVLFKDFLHLGTNSVWYAMVLSNVLICVLGFSIFITGKWQHKIIKDDKKLKEEVAV